MSKSLSSAYVTLNTTYGRISAKWEIITCNDKERTWVHELVVPSNSIATLYVPLDGEWSRSCAHWEEGSRGKK